MNLKKVTIRIVFTLLAVIALGSMIASCSNEEFEGPRLTLATRSTNNLVEYIKTGGSANSIMRNNNGTVTFYVKSAWTSGWLNYAPHANIIVEPSDVEVRLIEKTNVHLDNYETSHVPPYYKVNPSAKWASGIAVYTLNMEYEIVLPDTIYRYENDSLVEETVRYDTLKGRCDPCNVAIPDECLSKSN